MKNPDKRISNIFLISRYTINFKDSYNADSIAIKIDEIEIHLIKKARINVKHETSDIENTPILDDA